LTFWRDAAARFKDHPGVLFGLLNEPHGISWEVWRNGGTVQQPAEGDRPANEFESPGMQRLVDVVRDTGAHNIVVVGGLDWAYDLSGIVDGYALRDDRGNGIMYDTHIYPWKSGWERKVLPAAREYTVFVGECGCEPEPMPFVPPETHKDPYEWAPNLLGFIQRHRLHWTAWCFHPKATPRLIEDWDFRPTPFWGEMVKRALAGEVFEAETVY
jgi:endoglucanase